jgi:DNA polymerase III delta subunit
MYILANEIDKLSFYLRYHGKTVADEESMRLVCTPLNEYDTYAFANAIMAGRSEEALAILADYRFRRADPIRILAEMAGTICDMAIIRSMTAEGAPIGEICAAFKPAWHEYRVGLFQKSLRQISEKRLKSAMEFCLEADRALKLSPQGYTALEQLICKF